LTTFQRKISPLPPGGIIRNDSNPCGVFNSEFPVPNSAFVLIRAVPGSVGPFVDKEFLTGYLVSDRAASTQKNSVLSAFSVVNFFVRVNSWTVFCGLIIGKA